jgi:hypothetical protein
MMATHKIKQLGFTQYKRFYGTENLEVRPVTVLVGKNSSGKSSITKLMPILGKSISGTLKKTVLLLDSEGVSLGTSYQSLCHNGNSVGLAFSLSFSGGVELRIELISTPKNEIKVQRYTLAHDNALQELVLGKDRVNYECVQTGKTYAGDGFSGFIHKDFLTDCGVEDTLEMNVDYIGPLRYTPERTQYYTGAPLPDNVGPKGENAYQLLCSDDALAAQVSHWFEAHFGGCKLRVVPAGSEKGTYLIQMNKPDNGSYWVNIADEGMGMAQILPIVTRCIHAVDDTIVVMEQPELHLHPAAHESIAKLLATTSKQHGQRYVVETHSENILLGLRDAVVDKTVDFQADDVVIYFVDEDEEGAYLRKITLDENGDLSSWPEGVFNESYELLNKIISKATAHDL